MGKNSLIIREILFRALTRHLTQHDSRWLEHYMYVCGTLTPGDISRFFIFAQLISKRFSFDKAPLLALSLSRCTVQRMCSAWDERPVHLNANILLVYILRGN